MNLSLYRFRKPRSPLPPHFIQLMETKTGRWLIVEGTLPENELDRCDLIYCGQGMAYEKCLQEIDRLGKRVQEA